MPTSRREIHLITPELYLSHSSSRWHHCRVRREWGRRRCHVIKDNRKNEMRKMHHALLLLELELARWIIIGSLVHVLLQTRDFTFLIFFTSSNNVANSIRAYCSHPKWVKCQLKEPTLSIIAHRYTYALVLSPSLRVVSESSTILFYITSPARHQGCHCIVRVSGIWCCVFHPSTWNVKHGSS